MILVLMRNSLKWYTIWLLNLIFMHNCCSKKIISELILTNLECFSFRCFIFLWIYQNALAKFCWASLPIQLGYVLFISINSMQKYQVLYAQHIHVCTTYTYTVYIFATFNLCTDKNPVLKSHYTVLPEGEVPINYKFPKAIAKNNDNI